MPEPVEIAAGGVQLLPLDALDGIELLGLLTAPAVARWRRPPPPETADQIQVWIDSHLHEAAGGRALAWTIRLAVGGTLAGFITLDDLDLVRGTADVDIASDPAHAAAGVAPASLGAVTRYAFAALDLDRLTLTHLVGDDDTCEAASACGYSIEGTARAALSIGDQKVNEHLHIRLATDPAL